METEIHEHWATSFSDVAFSAVHCADRLSWPSTLRGGDGQVHSKHCQHASHHHLPGTLLGFDAAKKAN